MKCKGENQAKGKDAMSKIEMLKEHEAEELVGMEPGTLGELRKKGTGPDYMEVGGSFYYTKESIRKWVGVSIKVTPQPAKEPQKKRIRNRGEMGLITEIEAAKVLGFTRNWLTKLRGLGTGPAFIKLGGAIRYRKADLEAWVEGNTYQNTSQIPRKRGTGDE
jgi:predicted DNA-binding transcriptional regulator AlpA